MTESTKSYLMMDLTTILLPLAERYQGYHMGIESSILSGNVNCLIIIDYVWSKKHKLFMDMVMDPCSKKGFLSKR